MKDINFWIGTGVGFVSAILGGLVAAWVQYKFKIKEIEYMMDQEKVKRREEELTREEAESKKFRKLIMATRHDVKEEPWNRPLLGYRGRPAVSALRWYMSDDYYNGDYKEQLLSDMNLDELKALYAALLSAPLVSSAIERSEQKIEQTVGEMSEMLKYTCSKLARDEADNTRQK